jgi:hypothetical protein
MRSRAQSPAVLILLFNLQGIKQAELQEPQAPQALPALQELQELPEQQVLQVRKGILALQVR